MEHCGKGEVRPALAPALQNGLGVLRIQMEGGELYVLEGKIVKAESAPVGAVKGHANFDSHVGRWF